MSVVPSFPKTPSGSDNKSGQASRKSASVPLGIWLCAPTREDEYAPPPLLEGLTRALVTQAVDEFTTPGQTVAITGPDAARITAVAATVGGRSVVCADPETITHGHEQANSKQSAWTPEPGSVDLIFATELPAPWISKDGEPYRNWARWLAPGGVLAVAARNPSGTGRFVDHTAAIIAAATNAGLSYLQHIIAVLAHVEGDRLLLAQPAASVTLPAETAQAHTDLLAFHNDLGGAA